MAASDGCWVQETRVPDRFWLQRVLVCAETRGIPGGRAILAYGTAIFILPRFRPATGHDDATRTSFQSLRCAAVFTIQTVPFRRFLLRLNQQDPDNPAVQLQGPYLIRKLIPPPAHQNIVMIAAGTGINPSASFRLLNFACPR